MSRFLLAGLVLSLACPVALIRGVRAGESGDAPAVLDEYSYWRCHTTLRPPLIGTAADAKPAFAPGVAGAKSRLEALPPDQPSSPLPPADWAQPDFDDSGWWRDPGPFFGGSARNVLLVHHPHASRYGNDQSTGLALFCVRGRFAVTDPGQVRRLALSCEFRGGLRVYLNGQEVARRHLPDGSIGFETLAEDYPADASAASGGGRRKSQDDGGMEKRVRKLEPFELPVKLLRKGTNVLALEIHRSATPAELWVAWEKSGTRVTEESAVWSTVALLSVRLSAEGGGVVPNTARPRGVQVWNASVAEGLGVTDYGDPNEPLRPVRIVGARNGTFSGQVVVSSDAAIAGLEAEMSPLSLKGGAAGGAGPVAALRYPRLGRAESYAKSTLPVYGGSGTAALQRLEILEESPPAETPVQKVKTVGRTVREAGAVQPVWISVRVPADAPAGTYEGKLTVRVKGSAPVAVPVQLEVSPFRLPDPGDYVTWIDLIQSPETLSLRYGAPLWSDEHFRLIEKSFRIMAGVGNKTLYIPLICRTNLGNSESMVRWIKNGDGNYDHDFRPMEQYIDLALKCGLKPKAVCLQIWDYHVGHATDVRLGHLGASTGEPGSRPVPVSRLDPATGKVDEIMGPACADAKAEAFWAPVAQGVRERLKARGLGDAVMVGLCSDSVPGKEVIALWDKLMPEAPWAVMAHGWSKGNSGGLSARQRVGYVAFVVGEWGLDPGIRRDYGWQPQPETVVYFPRLNGGPPLAFHRSYFELNLQSGRRGVGRLAGDFFPVSDSAKGSRDIAERYPESSWSNLNLREEWLAAGKDGALPTEVIESAREGIQECEARIFIEKALLDAGLRAKLPAALAEKCQALLDERTRCIAWATEFSNVWGRRHSFLNATGGVMGWDWYTGGSRIQDMSEKLYSAAGEVAKALGQ